MEPSRAYRVIRHLSLAAAVMAGICALPPSASAQVPTIDIKATCQAAASVMVNLMGGSTTQNDVEICMETENKAREQINKEWSTFRPSDRQGCVQADIYLPSYVEWLTCFEMNKVVREARQQQGRTLTGITNPDGSVTLPRVRAGRFY
jgi:hypothetical protein